MFELMVEDHFDAAHRIEGHPDKCANVHGHTWKVRMIVKCTNQRLNTLSIAVDFGTLKAILAKCVKQLDHHDLNQVLEGLNPTAETLAQWFYHRLYSPVADLGNVWLCDIMVYESADTGVRYYET